MLWVVLMFWHNTWITLGIKLQLCRHNQIISHVSEWLHLCVFLPVIIVRDLPWSWWWGHQWVQVCHLLPSEAATLVWNDKGVSLILFSTSSCFFFVMLSNILVIIFHLDCNSTLFDIIFKSIIHRNKGIHHQQFVEWKTVVSSQYSPMQLWSIEKTVMNLNGGSRKWSVTLKENPLHSAPNVSLKKQNKKICFQCVFMGVDVSHGAFLSPVRRLPFLSKTWTGATCASPFATAHRRTVSTNVAVWIISFADDQLHNWLLIYPLWI